MQCLNPTTVANILTQMLATDEYRRQDGKTDESPYDKMATFAIEFVASLQLRRREMFRSRRSLSPFTVVECRLLAEIVRPYGLSVSCVKPLPLRRGETGMRRDDYYLHEAPPATQTLHRMLQVDERRIIQTL